MEIELNIPETEITGKDISVETGNTNIAVLEDTKDLDITYNRKEYSIIGDGIFISSVLEDVPEWLGDLIDSTFEAAILSRDQNLINRMEAILTALDYVPKNRYTEQINQIVDEDGIINTRIATLNSNLTDALTKANATIAEIDLTYASKNEAAAIATNVLTASLSADGEIGSTLIELKNAYADLESTTAESIILLESVMEGEINGNASAMQTIRSYVGIDEAGASTGTGLLADVEILQKQNDGVIETTTGTYDVMISPENPDLAQLVITAEPYVTWKAADVSGIDTRLAHIGDVYVKYADTSNGAKEYVASYKFIRTVVDSTSPYATDSDGFTWALIIDQASQDAYTQALNAYDLADGKRRVYVGLGSTTTPSTPYDQGDLWLIDSERIVDGYQCKIGDILRCIETKGNIGTYEENDWVLASSYESAVNAQNQLFQSFVDNDYATFVSNIQDQVDTKAETFYQNSVPTGRIKALNVLNNTVLNKYVGDLWKNTYVGTVSGYLGDNTEYVYTKKANGANWDYNWTKMEVPDIVFDTIDTKKSIYSGDSVPVAVVPDVIEVNDMWITGDNPVSPYIAKSIYVWNGTTWLIPVRYTDDQYAKDIENGTRKIDLSKHINSLGWQTLSQVQSESSSVLGDWITSTYTPDQISNQETLDGKIASYFTDDNVYPFNPSTGTLKEDGDLWYDSSTKLLKRFVYSQLSWVTIEDKVAVEAAAAASLAKETADGKIVTFLQPTQPVAVSDEGDIWIDTDDFNHMYRADSFGNWISVRDTANDTDLAVALNSIATLEETNDGVVNSFYQTTAPTIGVSYGDWWVDTDSVPIKAYRYEGINGKNVGALSWVDNSTHILGKAYIGAVGAQSTADGKIKTFYQNSIPTSEGVGDLWIDTDDNNKTYRAAIKGANEIKAGEWVRVTDESALDNFIVSTYSKDLLNIGNQIDGVAVTYFQNNEPYLATAGTSANSGDVWYDTDALVPTAYKFKYKTLGSDGVTVVTPSEWTIITNAFVLSSLTAANKTKAAADRSIKNYTSTPVTPYYEGDTWMQGSTGDIYVCDVGRLTGSFNQSDWVIASKYTNDSRVIKLETGIADGSIVFNLNSAVVGGKLLTAYVADEIDKEVVVYSGTNHLDYSSLGSLKPNDLYIEKTTAAGTSGVAVDVLNTWKCLTVSPTSGVVTSATWLQIGNNNNITALADLADGKRTVFSGNTVPVGAVARDIWIPSATNGTYLQGEIYQYSGSAWIVATKYSADLEAVRNNLQSQVDGKVDTYYQGTVPTGMTALNNGDYWYCTADISTYKKGKVYKYVHATTSWVETADVSRYAFDTADGKASIFTSTNAPTTGYKVNDMLIVIGSFNNGTTTFSDGVVLSSSANRVSGFTASDWVKKINDTEDLDAFVSVTYTPTVTSLQNQVDGKIESWYTASTSDPKSAWTDAPTRSKHDGDMWYQTDTKLSYYYSSSTNSWNLIDDAKAIQALTNAAAAQATADGVVVSYYAIRQDTQPAVSKLWFHKMTVDKVLKYVLQKYEESSWVNVDVKQGDTLTTYDTDTKDTSIYLYNSGNWVTEIENGIVASSEAITTLTSNLADTDFKVGGHTEQLNTVDARIADGVASVETKWAYNSTVKINGVSYSSGFGLATSLTSGSGLPTGQSEFWIKADKFKLMSADGLKKSSYSPFTVDSVTGEISFNGKVTFSNVTGMPAINKTYVQTSQPTSGMNNGDTWIDTNDNNSLYTYNGTSWIKTQSGAKTYLEDTAPTSGMIVGDMWVDSDDNYKQYRYNGSSWAVLAYNPATAINAGTTTIDGPKITTGSITAAQIQTNSISANKLLAGTNSTTVWTGGGLVSSDFNGNPYGSIGTPTQGFRLSASAAGTSSDPNIYGAYIKGATLEGTYLNIADIKVLAYGYPLNSGRLNITDVQYNIPSVNSTTITSTNFYGSGYSTGFLPTRFCAAIQRVKITFTSSFTTTSNIATATCNIQRDVGNGWVTLYTTYASVSLNEYSTINIAYVDEVSTDANIISYRLVINAGGSGLGRVSYMTFLIDSINSL